MLMLLYIYCCVFYVLLYIQRWRVGEATPECCQVYIRLGKGTKPKNTNPIFIECMDTDPLHSLVDVSCINRSTKYIKCIDKLGRV